MKTYAQLFAMALETSYEANKAAEVGWRVAAVVPCTLSPDHERPGLAQVLILLERDYEPKRGEDATT